MTIKVIKTEKQYQEYLAEVEQLVSVNPKIGSAEADRLELLSVLIEKYENEHYFIGLPDAIEAIKFRMEHMGFKQKDLIPYIGNKSKVSEVLSGKRSLTTEMIRALNINLGIPVNVLLQDKNETCAESIDLEKFPIKEMITRGWIDKFNTANFSDLKERIISFLNPIKSDMPMDVFCRRTIHERAGKVLDKYSLYVWIAAVLMKANALSIQKKYTQKIDDKFLREVVKLSRFKNGPLIAKNLLAQNGIALVIEQHLSKTKLDGCTFLTKSGFAVIGLTLRYDRLDNFWYTLMHELAHIELHIENNEIFIDNLDVTGDKYEQEADKKASEVLIPKAEWACSRAKREKSPDSIQELADRLEIHPAIIAGRIRKELNNYSVLNQLVGRGEVRCLFEV